MPQRYEGKVLNIYKLCESRVGKSFVRKGVYRISMSSVTARIDFALSTNTQAYDSLTGLLTIFLLFYLRSFSPRKRKIGHE